MTARNSNNIKPQQSEWDQNKSENKKHHHGAVCVVCRLPACLPARSLASTLNFIAMPVWAAKVECSELTRRSPCDVVFPQRAHQCKKKNTLRCICVWSWLLRWLVGWSGWLSRATTSSFVAAAGLLMKLPGSAPCACTFECLRSKALGAPHNLREPNAADAFNRLITAVSARSAGALHPAFAEKGIHHYRHITSLC